MDSINNLAPLFEAHLELREPDLIYTPTLDPNDPKSFQALIEGLIEDILNIAAHFPRVSLKQQITYLEEISSNQDIADMKTEILSNVHYVVKEATRFADDFQAYSYFWLDDRDLYLSNFLQYSRQLSAEEMELVENNDSLAPKLCPPKMEHFREQVK